MEQQKSVAKWILVVSGIFALMEIGVSCSLFFSPKAVLETVDLDAKGVDQVVYMWAVRQFALGFIFAFATIKRSTPMLTISYLFFLVMFIGDLIIGIQQKENGLVISAIVMCGIASGLIYVLNKRR